MTTSLITTDLEGKHAVITGGGTGIGAAVAKTLAEAGANVTVMGRRPEPLRKISDTFDTAQAVVCDVTSEESVEKAFLEAKSNLGPVEILVNSAGAAPTSPFHKLTTEDWREVMAVNLDGVFHCTSQVIHSMLELRWGRIINIASTAALRGYAYVSAYSAAKHGVLGLTRALALETASKGITVNAICPGFTDTDVIRNSIKFLVEKTGRSEEDAMEEFVRSNPQGRLIQPQEIATSLLWLCGDNSDSITGQAISISGGEVM